MENFEDRFSNRAKTKRFSLVLLFKILIIVVLSFTIFYAIFLIKNISFLLKHMKENFENFTISDLDALNYSIVILIIAVIIFLIFSYFIEIIFAPDLSKISFLNTLLLSLIVISLIIIIFNPIKFGIYSLIFSFVSIIFYCIYQIRLFSNSLKYLVHKQND